MTSRFFVLALVLLPLSARASPEDLCLAQIAAVAELAAGLPDDDLSRRFAEADLSTARVEMEAGEVEDCPDYVARARRIVITRPYALRPGETLGVRPPH